MTDAKPLVRAVIFDLDGTLLDTESLSTEAIQSIVGRFGKCYSWDINERTLGKRGDVWTKIVVDALDLHGQLEPHDLFSQWEHAMACSCDRVAKLPGAMAIIEELYRRGIPMAIATSSSSSAVEKKRTKHEDMFSLMSIVVCGDDPEVHHGKPYPDIYLTAARRLGIDPSHCLAFEDALSGVQAAAAAGMAVIACPDPRLDLLAFKAITPHVVSKLVDFDFSTWEFVSDRT